MEDYSEFEIAVYEYWTLFLHKNQNYVGRVYFWAKRDDNVDIFAITKEERDELFDKVQKVKLAITELSQPDKFNYAGFQNTEEHLHLHIIPRYRSSRMVLGLTFTDERWGENYAPYNEYGWVYHKNTRGIFRNLRNLIKEKLE
jgi:diadenosine tetraphosphate (Ap4A) HIT family hydrolase